MDNNVVYSNSGNNTPTSRRDLRLFQYKPRVCLKDLRTILEHNYAYNIKVRQIFCLIFFI